MVLHGRTVSYESITFHIVYNDIPANQLNYSCLCLGWFYHAPCKKNATNPVGAPPPSQIPGLGEIGAIQKEQPKEMVFRATDSKYIRKAKMGGIKGCVYF